MFEIQLKKSIFGDETTLQAKCETLQRAIAFVESTCGTTLYGSWTQRDGALKLDVYDFWEAWCGNHILFATIVAPPGFKVA